MLSRELRLTKGKQFYGMYRHGTKQVGSYMVIFYRPNAATSNRYGFSVSRKIGNAVMRNRVKRRLREVVRHHEHRVKTGYDFVIVSRSSVHRAEFKELEREFITLLERENLIE